MYTLRIPGHQHVLTADPNPTGTKEEIAKKLLFPNPDKDVHGIRRLPRDTDCILEETETIQKGKIARQETHQVGRWTIGQLLPQGTLNDLIS
ncbi:hypothetical protein SH668x_002414 [Planctomicrobium sp. SH668]|uniref:hypothetical protein n=1 Tax=Planctomicrobium sp. SH668 TaxID=3448126 RepID=UPI003F5B4DC3